MLNILNNHIYNLLLQQNDEILNSFPIFINFIPKNTKKPYIYLQNLNLIEQGAYNKNIINIENEITIFEENQNNYQANLIIESIKNTLKVKLFTLNVDTLKVLDINFKSTFEGNELELNYTSKVNIRFNVLLQKY